MGKMQELARDIRVLNKMLDACTQCGMCQAVCPLFDRTRREPDVSRGKIALLKGLCDQVFKDAKGVRERLDRCLLCGSCAAACPSGVDSVKIFIMAKSIITRYLGLPFAQKILLRKILARPDTFDLLSSLAGVFQSVLFKQEKNPQKTSCARIVSPLLRDRSIAGISRKTFHGTRPRRLATSGKDGLTVGFFVGCLVDKAYPQIGHSVMDVLSRFNVNMIIPENQGCCGIPAAAAGDEKTFKTLVRLNTKLFARYQIDYLVTACATCSSTIVKLWPELMDSADPELKHDIQALAEKTVDISWLLAKRFDLLSLAGSGEKNGQAAVTVHDPCHLKKSLGVFQEPRQVVQACGHDILEMKNNDACCGMGGSFNLSHYDLSTAIGHIKAQNIIQSGAAMVATSCPACMMQISDMLAKAKSRITVHHPVELLAASLRKSGQD